MTERLKRAQVIRLGAERLRQMAAAETDRDHASEMIEIAAEMEENAARLERSFASNPPRPANEDDAVA